MKLSRAKTPPQSKRSTQAGFTLVELLFATVLLGLMLTLTMQTFIALLRFYSWANTTRTNQAAARQTMDDLTRQIHNGQVSIGYSSPSRLCVLDSSSGSSQSTEYDLDSGLHRVVKRSFATNSCRTDPGGGPDFAEIPGSLQIISPASEQISQLTFTITRGSPNAPAVTPYNLAGGVIIDMAMINVMSLTPDNVTLNPDGSYSCLPENSFCGIAHLTTAVQAADGVQ